LERSSPRSLPLVSFSTILCSFVYVGFSYMYVCSLSVWSYEAPTLYRLGMSRCHRHVGYIESCRFLKLLSVSIS
jgi:hypothetical protein